VHYAKVAFEKSTSCARSGRGTSEPFYERIVLDRLGIRKVRETA
jgi:hypothetical protein